MSDSKTPEYINPLIVQRADPYIYKHTDGYYYFTASVPAYNLIEIRRAKTLAGLAHAAPRTIWRKHESGPMSQLIWAPEIHYIDGKWFIYFAAAETTALDKLGMFQHRMFCIECDAEDPMRSEDDWFEHGQVETGMDSFCLDATCFQHDGKLYYVWAQKDPDIKGNSNLYIAEMANPWTLKTKPVMLSKPEFDWETIGFWVNEGPAVIHRNGRFFLTYSASATDEHYAMGMLSVPDDANLLDASKWTKSKKPVFQSDMATHQYGPGHNSFTVAEDGKTDILVYHCRDYTEIKGDPLYDPNRHTKVQPFTWNADGTPHFGKPVPYNYD
ncbi:alpha-N-arabinofuranosidase [Lentilactobacillus parafarraginis]|jgi:GH43 family beta-xylosidase|uniref:Glycosyl hydrolase, family 43 n=3 Tax=Lentilactobacillus parafarraginis TaxID=390842 RepID=A0A0R1YPU4_9LACO|nr:family 43 glycosylhydrolase [Lentilactobacillus parafarraginis]EHM00091.1 glycosyl hydrolase, family 43 [Lentilactobacillus parafarraginis F0439]KRM44359.1 glycosyl hydrolase, family 43 [Lentilactobacillus parafarraginis DSM 18390 = JCM 14109]TLQ17376.1 alpha-N-arabinofuranosidase [Lentilactobacillus parafarraginis]